MPTPGSGPAAVLVAILLVAGAPDGVRAVQEAEPVRDLPVAAVIAGEVVRRTEVWDRRTNPLMGRPDILMQIDLEVRVTRVLSGDLDRKARQVAVAIKGQSLLIEYRYLAQGWTGNFHLAEGEEAYELVRFADGVAPPDAPRPKPKPVAGGRPLTFPENVGGREMRKSKPLQQRAVREISRRYGMEDASVVFLVSNRGPCPPEGGYVYWGVKGLINGRWHIWQAGGNGRPREGTDLIDPKRHQK